MVIGPSLISPATMTAGATSSTYAPFRFRRRRLIFAGGLGKA